jgi:predicted transcriptional regulator
MNKKKGKAISFDAMVKFFMQNYNIPTKKDVDKLMAKLDRIENLLRASASIGPYPVKNRVSRRKTALTAIDIVYDVIKRSRKGLGFTDIQAKTGFGDKKIRNIIFRLNKNGKIKRKSRGIYTAV